MKTQSGFILVTVLWTIALLAALAMAASASFRQFAGIVAIDRDKARSGAMLDAGMEAAGGIVAKLSNKIPLTDRDFVLNFAAGSVHVYMSDEAGRIDVNKAPVPVLAAMLQSAGAGDKAQAIAQAIEAWRQRDRPGAASPQARNTPQTAAGQAGAATPPAKDNGFRSFTDLRELVQVPGMTRDYLDGIAPLATVYGDEKLNIMSAPPEVLATLPGVAPAQVSSIMEMRGHSLLTTDWVQRTLGPASEYVKTDARPVASVVLVVRLIDGYVQANKAVVVALLNDKQPYRVLAWRPFQITGRNQSVAQRF